MAVTNGTLTGTTIAGGTIGMVNTNTSGPMYNHGYNIASDTVFGVPSYEWSRMSSMEQRYYAERWHEQERQRVQHEQDRRYRNEMNRLIPEAPKTSKAPEPSFTSNKLLLLEN